MCVWLWIDCNLYPATSQWQDAELVFVLSHQGGDKGQVSLIMLRSWSGSDFTMATSRNNLNYYRLCRASCGPTAGGRRYIIVKFWCAAIRILILRNKRFLSSKIVRCSWQAEQWDDLPWVIQDQRWGGGASARQSEKSQHLLTVPHCCHISSVTDCWTHAHSGVFILSIFLCLDRSDAKTWTWLPSGWSGLSVNRGGVSGVRPGDDVLMQSSLSPHSGCGRDARPQQTG